MRIRFNGQQVRFREIPVIMSLFLLPHRMLALLIIILLVSRVTVPRIQYIYQPGRFRFYCLDDRLERVQVLYLDPGSEFLLPKGLTEMFYQPSALAPSCNRIRRYTRVFALLSRGIPLLPGRPEIPVRHYLDQRNPSPVIVHRRPSALVMNQLPRILLDMNPGYAYPF